MPRARVTTATAVKPGGFAQDAQAVVNVLHHILQPGALAGVAAFFFAFFEAAHFEQRCAASFLRRHACGNVVLGFLFEVIAELLV